VTTLQIVYLEPFDGGSHAQFTRALTAMDWARWTSLTLPARHWKWRMRGAASHFALEHADVLSREFDLLIASAYLPLAELIGLVPALAEIPRVLYFHENQLAYPVQEGREDPRDLHFGFTQLVSGLAATRLAFNSAHNRDSFLEAGARLLASMPDAVPAGWIERLTARSEVWPLPLALPAHSGFADRPLAERSGGPLIVWNHRWEFDKGPDVFFDALERLKARGVAFRLAVCGNRFRRVPPVFERARARLADCIEHWGTLATRDEYLALLARAQLCVSTAAHEFFGISMLEATHMGARPLVPDRLAYPEHFPVEYRYADDDALVEVLARLCTQWSEGAIDLRGDWREITRPYEAEAIALLYRDRCRGLVRAT
jgi:glycosyltransferase involved in cell wall biosynthesis